MAALCLSYLTRRVRNHRMNVEKHRRCFPSQVVNAHLGNSRTTMLRADSVQLSLQQRLMVFAEDNANQLAIKFGNKRIIYKKSGDTMLCRVTSEYESRFSEVRARNVHTPFSSVAQ